MKQQLQIITLGVADLPAATQFYEEALGWRRNDDNTVISFFNLGGYILALYPHTDLAEDISVPAGQNNAHPYKGFALSHNLNSREEVDQLFAELASKNVQILKEPQAASWGGYSGYFADLDGHAWEVAHNPNWNIADDGRMGSEHSA